MNLAALTLRVAVLRIRRDRILDQYETARLDAQAAYKTRNAEDGTDRVTVRLPGGRTAGKVSVHAGAVDVAFDDDALLAFVEETAPDKTEDYLTLAAASDDRVLDLIRERFPELAGRRVKPAYRAELASQIKEDEANDGELLHEKTGDLVRVANVTRHDPNGEFTYTPGKPGIAAIQRLLDTGILTPDGEIAAAKDSAL